MEIEYDSDKFDSIIAHSAEEAVRLYKKEIDDDGVPYSGIVATEKNDIDAINKSAYLVRAIVIDSVME
jgi:hypothetical protein